MYYKTIVLRLLEERPQMHERLRQEHQLLSAMNLHARELKASHEEWKEYLAVAKPGSDPIQIASEAMEMALKELEDRLPAESPPSDDEPFSLDEAMAFVLRHTPRE